MVLLTSIFSAGFALLLAAAQGAAPGELRWELILPGVVCHRKRGGCQLPDAALRWRPLFHRPSIALGELSGSFAMGSGVFLVMRLRGRLPCLLAPCLLAGFLGGPVIMFLVAPRAARRARRVGLRARCAGARAAAAVAAAAPAPPPADWRKA